MVQLLQQQTLRLMLWFQAQEASVQVVAQMALWQESLTPLPRELLQEPLLPPPPLCFDQRAMLSQWNFFLLLLLLVLLQEPLHPHILKSQL